MSPYIAPSTSPLASCCRNCSTGPPGARNGCGQGRWSRWRGPERPGLDGRPAPVADAVHGQDLRDVVAVLVERHPAGRPLEGHASHRAHDLATDRVVDAVLAGQRLEDRLGGVV